MLVLLAMACNARQDKSESASDVAMETAPQMAEQKADFISSSAAVENKKDSTRKFIRTAEMKFKVKNVFKSTNHIEEITIKQGGFVTYTNLTSTIQNTIVIAVSADSSLETKHYYVENTMTLRVPNTKLDTTLKIIAGEIDYLDFRMIKAEDVALQMLSNDLTQKRSTDNEKRLKDAIDNRGKKLDETTSAEELLLRKKEESDNAKIANLAIKDQINFSTISLNIYQRETIKRELIPNHKNIEQYEPSFGSKLYESLVFGGHILAEIFIFLSKLWGLFLIIIVGYLLYKYLPWQIKK